jgi:hypothetical protein
LRLGHPNHLAHRPEQRLGAIEVVGGRMRAGGDRTHGRPDQRRRIRHHPHDRHTSGKLLLDSSRRNARGNRHHQMSRGDDVR